MRVVDGWLEGVVHRPSPNQDARPDPTDVSLLVIHGISLPPGEFGGPWIDALFANRLDLGAHPYFARLAGLTVSAHVLIRRDGEVVQYVPFHARAWHAGDSCFADRARCNDYSVGIELEGADELQYTAPQYDALAAVTRAVMAAYPAITAERIAGHCDIAPGRKTDPGPAFDWPRFRTSIAERRATPSPGSPEVPT